VAEWIRRKFDVPMEAVGSWLKNSQSADYTPADIDELDGPIVDRLIELKFNRALLKALWDRSELPFPNTTERRTEM